ncbi:MAG TPA: GyrI-like domain-containing protein [Candidatus Cloacimonadota bacterium]|nr:GyrI-like domain-containing protein [Candidatus Cloacimonadota bacterium]HQH50372.1 GyrI-like domain-containing protein [Candidatus Cloacimonadota bacterium]
MRWLIALVVLSLALAPLAGQTEEKQEPAKQMKVRFEARKPFSVMGLEAENAMEGNAMAEIWNKFYSLMGEIKEPVGNCCYGIHFTGEDYDPKTQKGYKYFVGMEVKESEKLPEMFMLHNVPGGDYAVFDYVGNIKGIGSAYGYIFGEWLASSGLILAKGDMFEAYDERFAADSDESVVEIWIPVQKLELKAASEDAPLKENNLKKKNSE